MPKMGMTYKDKEITDILMRTGLQRNVAKSLAYLMRVRESNSKGIEDATGLRQPEVSIAMQKLRTMGWVSKRDIKKSGKGRPTHAYTLNTKPNKIIRKIEESELRKIRDIKDNVGELKKLFV